MSAKPSKAGELVIIGGHEDREGDMPILQEFARLAGGEQARLVIMTTATEHPEEMGALYTNAFSSLGVRETHVVDVEDREDAYRPEALQLLEQATGVFFTGGSQQRITSLLGGSPLDDLLCRRQREEGLVVAGTSAGATMMADTMLLQGSGETSPRVGGVLLGSGMGLVSSIIIDMHFAERGRINRLMTAVAQHPRYLGLGIDENTALIVSGSQFRVIGEGSVTVLDAAKMQYSNFAAAADDEPLALEGMQLSIVPTGYGFDLNERRLLKQNELKM